MRMTQSPLVPLSSTGREIGAREVAAARELARETVSFLDALDALVIDDDFDIFGELEIGEDGCPILTRPPEVL